MCLMVKDIHHPRKTTRIIDNIALNHDIPTMTQFIQKQEWLSDWDARDQNESNYTYKDRHKKVMKWVRERWAKYGYLAMDSLNNMDANMLKVNSKHNEKSKDETEQALAYYENKMFDGERNTKTIVNDDAFKAVLNPMFSNWILNFQKPAFKKLMQSSKWYDGQMDSDSREMRKHLTRKVNVYSQDLSGMKYAQDADIQEIYAKKFSILYRKFCEYFKEDLVDADQKTIIDYFKAWRILDTKDSVLSIFKERKYMNSFRDGASQKWFESFLHVFDENKELLINNPDLVNTFKS